MKERPIIMSGDNPKLIREGHKIHTRRLQGLESINICPDEWILHTGDERGFVFHKRRAHKRFDYCFHCPYGIAGDRLWVRERFTITKQRKVFKARGFAPLYELTGFRDWHMESFCIVLTAAESAKFKKWKRKTGSFPSIFMFRSLSRITREITKVRVERLQDITEADAVAEGIKPRPHDSTYRFAAEDYAHLWQSLHGSSSWDKNPWVWVIEFKKQ